MPCLLPLDYAPAQPCQANAMTTPPEPPTEPSNGREHPPVEDPSASDSRRSGGRFVAAPTEPAGRESPDASEDPPPPSPRSRLGAWAATVALAGLLLALLQLLQVAGSVAEGLAVPSSGPQGLAGDVWQRIGYAFLTNVTVANALVLVVAVLMAAAPAVLRASSGERSGRLAAELTAIVTAVTAAALGLGSVLAVRTRLHQFALLHQAVPSYQRRSLFTFVAGSVGGCIVAFMLALTLPRVPGAPSRPGEAPPHPD